MINVDLVQAVADKGLAGDERYFGRLGSKTGQPTRRQVSLIERETLAEHAKRLAVGPIRPGDARANIETTGVRLCDFLGKNIRIGTALLRVYENRVPCHKMDRVCQGLRALMEDGRQGVLAEVAGSGEIRTGDRIEEVNPPAGA